MASFLQSGRSPQTATGQNPLADEPACIVRSHEGYDIGDILRLTETSGRSLGDDAGLEVGGEHDRAVGALRLGEAGADRVNPDFPGIGLVG